MLPHSCLGCSGYTMLIPNLQFETNSGRKYQENIYKGNLIRYYNSKLIVGGNIRKLFIEGITFDIISKESSAGDPE